MKVVRNFFMTLSVVLGANITQAALCDVGGKVIFSMKYLLQNHFHFLMLAIAPLLLSACGAGENKCLGTIAISVPKIILVATDTNGNKLTNYVIAYQTNSRSGSKTLTCDSVDGCDLEFSGEGDVAITVSKVGYESVSLKTSIQVIDNCGQTNIERLSVKLKPL